MINDDYAPGFKTKLHIKDMNIVSDVAKELGISLPVSSIGLELLERTANEGYAEQDSSAMYEIIKKN